MFHLFIQFKLTSSNISQNIHYSATNGTALKDVIKLYRLNEARNSCKFTKVKIDIRSLGQYLNFKYDFQSACTRWMDWYSKRRSGLKCSCNLFNTWILTHKRTRTYAHTHTYTHIHTHTHTYTHICTHTHTHTHARIYIYSHCDVTALYHTWIHRN
mgnify:FL=1